LNFDVARPLLGKRLQAFKEPFVGSRVYVVLLQSRDDDPKRRDLRRGGEQNADVSHHGDSRYCDTRYSNSRLVPDEDPQLCRFYPSAIRGEGCQWWGARLWRTATFGAGLLG